MIYLETERLIIREHKAEDLENLFSLYSDKKAMYYLPRNYIEKLEEADKFLLLEEIGKENRERYFFSSYDKQDGAYIGEIGYTVNKVTPVGKIIGAGYFLRPEFWGKGYATEAFKELIRFAFEDDNVFRIEAGCNKENTGSEKVMLKCGMIKEGEFKSCTWHDGKIKDRVSYRLLKSEWKK